MSWLCAPSYVSETLGDTMGGFVRLLLKYSGRLYGEALSDELATVRWAAGSSKAASVFKRNNWLAYNPIHSREQLNLIQSCKLGKFAPIVLAAQYFGFVYGPTADIITTLLHWAVTLLFRLYLRTWPYRRQATSRFCGDEYERSNSKPEWAAECAVHIGLLRTAARTWSTGLATPWNLWAFERWLASICS
jgi:hypothetical protein